MSSCVRLCRQQLIERYGRVTVAVTVSPCEGTVGGLRCVTSMQSCSKSHKNAFFESKRYLLLRNALGRVHR